MDMGPRPGRRVVTGNDAQGRSRVVWDSDAPNSIGAPANPGGGMLEFWRFAECPVDLSDERDLGNLAYHFEPDPTGATFRMVQAAPVTPDHVFPPQHEPEQRPGGTWDRGGKLMHKTETVDYGIIMEGSRFLVLDDGEILVNKGDVVVQVGAWHGWYAPKSTVRMAFIMMGAPYEG